MHYNTFRKAILKFPVFSNSMLGTLSSDIATLKVQICHWKQKGLVESLRKGLYVLGEGQRLIEPSRFFLANQILIPSYVSMESALSFYDMIPEYVASATSITVRKTCRFNNGFGEFIYQHIGARAYGGFKTVKDENGLVTLVASPEKAVVDFLYLNLPRFDRSDRDIFQESYRFQNCENLNEAGLRENAHKFASKKLKDILELFIEECVR